MRNGHFTLPVKTIAAKSGELVTVSPNVGPSAGKKLITPVKQREIEYVNVTWTVLQTVWQSGFAKNFENNVIWEHGGIRRFPLDNIALRENISRIFRWQSSPFLPSGQALHTNFLQWQ